MSRRIDIELTSARPDGTWTWRAAGAREPKGVLDGGLLHAEAKPGDVFKAEAEFEIDGITITSVLTPKPDRRPDAQRIEILGPGRSEGPGVTTQLVGRSERRPGDRRREREDGGRRRERAPGRPQTGRPQREQAERPERAGGQGRARAGTDGGRESPRRERPARPESGHDGERRAARPRRGPAEPAVRSTSQAERTKGRRLNPGNAYRKAVLDSLPPEQQPIAEQVLRGGIPAVRTALHLEREKAEAEGRPAPNADELIAMAEALLPRIRAAEWRDRAEAAAAAGEDISMRDLRSVVAGGDLARDDETRALAATLRETLAARLAKLHQDWAAEITANLDAHKTVRALRLSARPPEPTARLEAELAQRLAAEAGASMTPDTAPDLWAALLEAAAASPVRRTVVPAGLPENAPPDLKRSAHQLSGNIPALAKLLGVPIPPPPAPVPARRRGESPSGGGRRKRPRDPQGESKPEPEAQTEPAQTEPAQTERAETEATHTEPAQTEPAHTEPAESEPEPRPDLPVEQPDLH